MAQSLIGLCRDVLVLWGETLIVNRISVNGKGVNRRFRRLAQIFW
jgi:hypothetical protein